MLTNVVSKEAVLTEARNLAETEGTVTNAKIELLITMARGAAMGKVAPSDAVEIFNAYRAARDAKTYDPNDLGKGGMSPGYVKKSTSEWKAVITCGCATAVDGDETLARTRDLAKENGAHIYDSIVKIAREQVKVKTSLTDEEIVDFITKEKEAPDNSEMAMLEALMKQVEKIVDGSEGNDKAPPRPAYPSEEMQACLAQIRQRIAVIKPQSGPEVMALMKNANISESKARKLLGLPRC